MDGQSLDVLIDDELADRIRPVGTRIEVAMTIYRIGTSVQIPPDGRQHEIPGVGICSRVTGPSRQLVMSCDSAGYPTAIYSVAGQGGMRVARARTWDLFALSPVFSWSNWMDGDASQMLTVEWPVTHLRREITLDRPWQRAR